MKTMISMLQKLVFPAWQTASRRCNDWSGRKVANLQPRALLDVGCGDGMFLLNYLDYRPDVFCGVEASPVLRQKAELNGLQTSSFDLNGRWPYASDSFDVVHSSQVIEHLHNTRLFVSEAYRVLKPGGTALITSENLTSYLNLTAMVLGYTPFTLARICGYYLGNPLGLHANEHVPEDVPMDDPAYSGVTGHVRALSVMQASELFALVGFNAKVSSIGLMPLPAWCARLERWMPRRGHLLTIEARKQGV